MPDLLHEGIYIYCQLHWHCFQSTHSRNQHSSAPSQEVCRKWLCSPKRFENDIPFSYVLGHLSNLSSFWVLQLLHTNCFTLAFFRRFGSSESFLNLKPRCHVHCNQNQQACYQACTCSNSCRKTQDSNAHNTCVRSEFFFRFARNDTGWWFRHPQETSPWDCIKLSTKMGFQLPILTGDLRISEASTVSSTI